jgi:PHD/YefM family antitoxin component YafN of YafNO toxin-antitoxin module
MMNEVCVMVISAKSIVSNSDMIKKYKNCREIAEKRGKIFILKNNQPDAVLFSIAEYESISVIVEYIEGLGEKDAALAIEAIKIFLVKESIS